MDDIFQVMLRDYIKSVENVCEILIRNLNTTESIQLRNKHDFFSYRAKCRKMEFEAEGINYKLNAKGCIAYSSELFIDWDFGYRSRWCGIDPWKVAMTLRENNSPFTEYYDGNLIHSLCEDSIKDGKMYKMYDKYYFTTKENDAFKPEFPSEYDTLIIEYFDVCWTMPRNKIIDRFIRKSVQIQKQISEDRDKYILRFLLDKKEVYSIPYNDTSYPENAVKIMSDEIIKNCRRNFL